MNTKQKSLAASALGVLAATVWIPQFLGRGTDQPEAAVELAADGSSSPDPAGEPAPAPTSASVAPPTLDGLDEELAALDAGSTTFDLGSLLASLPPDGTLPESEESELLPVAPRDLGLLGRERLDAFVAEHRLTGILSGPQGARALLGHRVVRAGDEFRAEGIEVAAVEAGWIELRCGEDRRVLELPAFEAGQQRAPLSPSSAAPSQSAPVEAVTPGGQP